MAKNIAMIPARIGSQRLKAKNLRELGGIPLITRAIRKCREAEVFDEIWVNSEHPAFSDIALSEGAQFHLRPEHLGDNQATSEQFVAEFLRTHACEYLFQVHSIAPLLTASEVRAFANAMENSGMDVLLSCEPIQIECVLDGNPINFNFSEKTNSQDIKPIHRITWSITGWRRSSFLRSVDRGFCATYAGRVGFHPVSHLAAHVIKTEEDLQFAEALLPFCS
jgi:CMP-N-acetylneuraminic acid synthetase